jgi:hypothetical protein
MVKGLSGLQSQHLSSRKLQRWKGHRYDRIVSPKHPSFILSIDQQTNSQRRLLRFTNMSNASEPSIHCIGIATEYGCVWYSS